MIIDGIIDHGEQHTFDIGISTLDDTDMITTESPTMEYQQHHKHLSDDQ